MAASKAIGDFSTRSEFLSWFILFIQEISPLFSYYQQNPQEHYHPNLFLMSLDCECRSVNIR
jgi:hypothetical protein